MNAVMKLTSDEVGKIIFQFLKVRGMTPLELTFHTQDAEIAGSAAVVFSGATVTLDMPGKIEMSENVKMSNRLDNSEYTRSKGGGCMGSGGIRG